MRCSRSKRSGIDVDRRVELDDVVPIGGFVAANEGFGQRALAGARPRGFGVDVHAARSALAQTRRARPNAHPLFSGARAA